MIKKLESEQKQIGKQIINKVMNNQQVFPMAIMDPIHIQTSAVKASLEVCQNKLVK